MKDKIIYDFDQFLLESKNEILSKCVVFMYNNYMNQTYFEYIPPTIDNKPILINSDFSGKVKNTPSKNKDHLTDSVSDFLDFYTGEKTPSFERGHGWYFDTVETNLRYFIGELIFGEYLKRFVDPRRKEISKEFNIDEETDIICDFLIFEDIMGDCNIEIEFFVIDYLRNSDWKLINEIHNTITKTK